MGSKRDRDFEKEILEVESKFGEAMIQNDVEAIGRILSDDWIIIDPEGGVVDKSRFLDVIRSGALKHEAMDSEDIRVRTHQETLKPETTNARLGVLVVGYESWFRSMSPVWVKTL